MTILYVVGDVTHPKGDGVKVIAHVANDAGGWGPTNNSVCSAISKRWKDPESEYRQQFADSEPGLKLGEVQQVQVEDDIWVANMVAQHNYRKPGNLQPMRYDALETCLKFLSTFWAGNNASFHLPRIGTGLGGADWHTVEHLIARTLVAAELSVTVYTLPP